MLQTTKGHHHERAYCDSYWDLSPGLQMTYWNAVVNCVVSVAELVMERGRGSIAAVMYVIKLATYLISSQYATVYRPQKYINTNRGRE